MTDKLKKDMDALAKTPPPKQSSTTAAMSIRMRELPHCHTAPTKGSSWAAAWDLYAAGSTAYTVQSFRSEKIPTGVAIEIPNHFCGLVIPRSGLGTKHLVVPANSPGLIDPDYRGEIFVGLTLNSPSHHESFEVQPGDRIAQLLILPYVNVEWAMVDELNESARGEAGFGSTGK